MPFMTNADLALLRPSGIRRFSALAATVPGCVRLTLGEPEFDTPQPVKDRLCRSLADGETHYPPNDGISELRDALSSYMAGQGLEYAPGEVIVTVGATEALSATLAALLDPADEVIVPVPAFGLYETIVRSLHGVVRHLDTVGHGFQIDPDDLEGLVGPRTKAIVITSPNNPTGCALDAESLDAVARVAAAHGIAVVCDDVYNRLTYDGGVERLAVRHPELRDRLVVVDSFSKPWAMTGWRVGWLAAAEPLFGQIEKMHQYMVSCVPPFVQRAAVTALGCDTGVMRQTYRARRDLVCERLGSMGLRLARPAGAFYAFPDVSGLGLGSEGLCERLIREAGVALVPGTCFGTEGHVRLSYCVSDADLALGLDRLGAWVARRREEMGS